MNKSQVAKIIVIAFFALSVLVANQASASEFQKLSQKKLVIDRIMHDHMLNAQRIAFMYDAQLDSEKANVWLDIENYSDSLARRGLPGITIDIAQLKKQYTDVDVVAQLLASKNG